MDDQRASRCLIVPSAGRSASRKQAPGAASPRIRGVDLARAIAITGMFAVHVGPLFDESAAGRVYALPHGRASILFLLVAGIGLSMLAGSRSTSPLEARVKLAWRAAILLPAGLALQLLDHGVLVILQDYAILFVLGIAVLGLGDRLLLGGAAVSAAAGPVVFLWGTIRAPDVYDRGSVSLSDPVGEIVHGLVLSGPYPLITFAAPFLFGMWLGRRDLRSEGLQSWLIAGGGTVAAGAFVLSSALVALWGEEPTGWARLMIDDPHSQMPLWVLGSTGSAAFVLGLSLAVAQRVPRLVWPLVAAGQLALTIYVGHLVAIHFAPDVLRSGEVGEAALLVTGFTVAGTLFAVVWRVFFARGPLEMVLRLPWPKGATPPGGRTWSKTSGPRR